MSSARNFMPDEEAAANELSATIKAKFEQDGVLQEVRCLLQSKMIALVMKGKSESKTVLQTTSFAGSDARMKVLHQLIMEYFHWHGFHYTAEMFSMESSCENVAPSRQSLENILGNVDHKDLPILLQLVATVWEKQNNNKTF